MFSSILDITTDTLSISSALLSLMVAFILGLLIAYTYMSNNSYSKNFAITLVTLPMLVQIVIMLVNGNLGTGVAIVGAFSLVRFRSIPGNSRDISFVFFTMAVGLATGMGYITFALASTILICGVFIILSKSKFGESNYNERKLRITIPENLDYTEVFDDLFGKYTKAADLERVKTTNLGSMFELQYKVILKDLSQEKSFIDDIRCRNGNLTIICSRNQAQHDEL